MMRRQKWLVRALTATSSVALLYMPQLACGQTATDNPTTSAKQLESAEIVVTAQRRAERAQDIPMTVNSASAERLAEANINSAVEIGKIVPAAQIIDNNGGVEPFIRGIGSNLNTIGADSSNAIYIDGVYQTRLSPILLTLNNVQRIEVLKGPQGTLFGRNSTGGLIQIITREPVPGDTPHVDVKAGFANYNTASASGYVSDSVSDKVAVDVSGVYRDQGSGWGRNLVTGLDTYTKSEYAIRSKIVFAPSSDTKIVVAGFYSHGKGDMGELINVQFGTVARSGIPDGSGLIPITGNYYDRISTAPTFDSSRTYGGSITASTSIGFAQVKNIMSYTNIRDQVTQDIDNTKLNYFVNDNRGYQRTFTNELQLLSKPSSAVQWVAGLFYLDSTFGYNPQLLYGSFIGGSLVITSNARTRSYAAYAQATVPISSRLKLTAGGRFSHDNLSAGGQEEFEGLGVIAPYSSASNQFDSGLWKFVLSYNASSDLMLYISQSRGAKPKLNSAGGTRRERELVSI